MSSKKQLDDARILHGEVSKKERLQLEAKLVRMLLERAKKNGTPVRTIQNHLEYAVLRENGELFKNAQYYILIDAKERIQDMTPIAYHLLDTPEGLFYAKLTQTGKCPLP